jgi:hypothetical protein
MDVRLKEAINKRLTKLKIEVSSFGESKYRLEIKMA